MKKPSGRKKIPEEQAEDRKAAERDAAAMREAERFPTDPGRESGRYCVYWNESSSAIVGQHVSWRRYLRLWELGHLEFQLKDRRPDSRYAFDPDMVGNPPHLPSYWAADVLAYVECAGRYETRSIATYRFDWRRNRPLSKKPA